MELKLSKSLVKKLLELANGATIPAAQFKGPLCEALLKDGCICSKSNKSVIRYYVTDKAAFRSVLGDYNDGLKDLEGTLTILQKENASRSEQVQIAGNSKIRQVRSCKGFLVNSYEPINCSLNERPFLMYSLRIMIRLKFRKMLLLLVLKIWRISDTFKNRNISFNI